MHVGVFEGWIGVLGVTSFSMLVWSLPAYFNKVVWIFPPCGAPASLRREFVCGVGSGTPNPLWTVGACLWRLYRERTDRPFWQGRELGCPLFTSGGVLAPLILSLCGFSGRWNKVFVCGQCCECRKSLAISCGSSLGNFWAVGKIADLLPWLKRSKGHWWQDMQRCCRALLQCMSSLAGTVSAPLQASRVKHLAELNLRPGGSRKGRKVRRHH